MQKNSKNERCTLCHHIIAKIMCQTHPQHSRYCLGGLRCPTKPSGSQGRCVPAWGGIWVPIPKGQGADLAAGCRWDCAGHREALAAHPTTPSGMEGWMQGCRGSPWLRQSRGCHGRTPRCTGDQEGSLAALRWIQASAEVFFHCLTPPAGELTQRKVRAWPHQGSVVKRRKLYWQHGQEYHLGPIYFSQGCSEWGNSFNVFTGSGINFFCLSMNVGNIKHIWVRVQQLIARKRKEMLPRILFICNHEKPLINSLLFGAYSKCLVYWGKLEIRT